VISLKNSICCWTASRKTFSRQFSDGEIQINIEESVRGVDVYIIQSTSFPVNNHLFGIAYHD
jgi:phosphoribosylpyrophosphate synthetase